MKSDSRLNNIFQNTIQPITKEFLFQCKFNPNHLDVRLPLFYKQILYLFQEMFQNDNTIENNALWFNDRLTIENKTIFHLDWLKKGIWQVCDLVDDNDIFCNPHHILETNSLYSLTSYRHFNYDMHFLVSGKHTLIHYLINLESSYHKVNVPISELKSNQVYWFIVQMKKRSPIYIRKWNETFNLEENDWAEMFYLPYSTTRETK